MNKYIERANEIAPEIIEIRRHIHQNAEHGFNLPLTVEYVTEKLKEWGYEPEHPCQGTITALAGDPSKGKVIALRADMDALPGEELTDLTFKSVTGFNHSCGHDIHTAMLLGAAKLLKEHESELNGAVKLLFQPAEEILQGAKLMIESGVLENPKVDAAMGIHIAPDHPVGVYAFRPGRQMAAASEFVIDVKGKSCHGGAFIHLGVDPINVAVHIHLGLQELIAREVKTIEPAVLSIGYFHAGTATNQIPDTAQMKGTVRSYSPEVQKMLLRRIKEVVEYTAKAYNAEATVTFLTDVPSLNNNGEMTQLLIDTIKEIAPEMQIADRQSLGCEDFAFIAEKVPSVYFHVGSALEDPEQRYPSHNPKVVFDERCIPVGIATHVAFAMNYLDK